MIFNNTNWHLYKSFLVVYETKNLQRAADILYVSRSAISQNIKELSNQLGVTLFTAHSKGVSPTGDANNLYPVIKNAITSIVEAETNLQEFNSESSGTIRIAIPDEPIDNFLSNYLREFSAKYPKVCFDFYRFNGLEKLEKGSIDFLFDYSHKIIGDNLKTIEVCVLHGNLIASKLLLKKHGLSGKISKKDFLKLPIITYPTDPLSEFYKQIDPNAKPAVLKTDSSNLTYFLVKNGLGVGWYLKESYALLNDPDITEVCIEGVTLPKSPVTCAYRANLSRPATAFITGLKNKL